MNFDTNANFDITDTAPEHKSGVAGRGDYDDFRSPSRSSNPPTTSGWPRWRASAATCCRRKKSTASMPR